MKRRVVITGTGLVSAIGVGAKDFWQGCLEGKSLVRPIPGRWRDYFEPRSTIWSPLPSLDYAAFGITRVETLQHDPGTLQALCAASQALQEAGLQTKTVDAKFNRQDLPGISAERAGVFMGTGSGGVSTLTANQLNHLLAKHSADLKDLSHNGKLKLAEETCAELARLQASLIFPRRFNPFVVSMIMPNAAASALSIKYGLHGPARTSCAACASGTVAIGQAFEAIRSGRLDLALAGGTEYLQDEYGEFFRGFDITGVLASDGSDPETANCPFDKRHSGFLFSQGGAAVLALEELSQAERRGAPIVAEVTGYAEASDAYHAMLMEDSGDHIAGMLQSLLTEAGLEPGQVDYINAHGTGTALNDSVEAKTIEKIFGARPLVNTTKSLVGHTLGASGAIEAAVTAFSLRDQTTHVCRNLINPIRELNFVRDVRPYPIRIAISQSFAFGGHNAALLLQQYT